ncbi:MAG: hypothetical protein WCR95_00565 [Eubacteriales bacterium]
MKVHKAPKAVLITLVIVVITLVLGFAASCAPQGALKGFIDSIPDLNVEEESSETSVVEEVSVPEGYAAPPEITNVFNVTARQVIITGRCDEGCEVTITDGTNTVASKSIEGHFVAEFHLSATNFSILSATAYSEDLMESDVTLFRAEYNSTAMKRIDGYGVTMGKDSHFYYDTDLSYYLGKNTLITQTGLKSFKNFVNIKVQNFQKRAGAAKVQLVYVLIPNAITIFPEYLAEETEKETYKTRYEQVVDALAETKAALINMEDIFLDAKEKGEKIFYDTDSHLTEYGGYLVYKAICDLMEKDFPDAAARDLEKDFTSSTRVLNGGNLARNLGVDPAVVNETATLYTPASFSLSVGKEDTDIPTASGFIKNFPKYAYENSMLMPSAATTLAGRLLFATKRTSLPCALIYRDSSAVVFSDILAERFNRVLLAPVNDFTVNMTDAQRYYGKDLTTGKDKTTVDYIFVIVSESNLGSILG